MENAYQLQALETYLDGKMRRSLPVGGVRLNAWTCQSSCLEQIYALSRIEQTKTPAAQKKVYRSAIVCV
jgi:hypothetical protein